MDNINIKNIPENERATQFPGGSEGALKQQQAQKQVQVEKYEDFLTVDDVMKEIGDHGQYIEGDMTLNLGQDVKITAGDIELKVQGRVEPYTRASLNIPENYDNNIQKLIKIGLVPSRSEAIREENRLKRYKDTKKFLEFTSLRMAPSSSG